LEKETIQSKRGEKKKMGLMDKMRDLVGIEQYEEEIEEVQPAPVKSDDMTKITPAADRFDSKTFAKAPSEPVAQPMSNTGRFTKIFCFSHRFS